MSSQRDGERYQPGSVGVMTSFENPPADEFSGRTVLHPGAVAPGAAGIR